MKKFLPSILVAVMLLIGLALLFYPDVSTWWNGRIQAGLLDQYHHDVAAMQQAQIDMHLNRANEVNEELSRLPQYSPLLIAHVAPIPADYRQILNINGTMGRVEIPNIRVNLPIFHTTSSNALDRGVGHLEGTAFPVGGPGTHSVLTAHTGLPNARLFTDLEGNVTYGDIFYIHVLNMTLAYQVDQILTVWPHEIESLRVIPGEDIVTLITCTPYGQNTQRLLVRGRRIDYEVAAAIVEDIVVDYVSNRVDARIYIFFGFFALFILGFMVYQIILGRREADTSPSPVPVGVPALGAAAAPVAAATALPIEREPPSISPTSISPTTHTAAFTSFTSVKSGSLLEKYMAKADTAARSQKPQAPVYTRPKPAPANQSVFQSILSVFGRALDFIRLNRGIAAVGAGVLVLIIVGVSIFALRSPSPAQNSQDAIYDFVSRIEAHRTAHNELFVAEMIAQGTLDLGVLYEDPFAPLHRLVKDYNQLVYERGQQHLPDPFTYSQPASSLSHFGFGGFDEEMIGYIYIPRIETTLPIFMGASQENLHRGLAHLTGTSLPVGGESTNAVIAGYMELGRNQKLRGVEGLHEGDELRVTNFYEVIIYTVIEIRSVNPHQTDALMIQGGRDLLTLLTYQQDNAHRYVIVAERSQ